MEDATGDQTVGFATIKTSKRQRKRQRIVLRDSVFPIRHQREHYAAYVVSQERKSNPLVFDHHHELDVFRGYCNRCNIGMGALGDNVSSIAGVLKYERERGTIEGADYGYAFQLIKKPKKFKKSLKPLFFNYS